MKKVTKMHTEGKLEINNSYARGDLDNLDNIRLRIRCVVWFLQMTYNIWYDKRVF